MTPTASAADTQQQVDQFRARFGRVRDELGRMIVGQAEIIESTLVAFFAAGHVLLEGVPGLGKTMLVRTLADAVNLKFSRVQFTPDLMPSDIIGTNIINEDEHGKKSFQFQPGPVFANILLADEINRAHAQDAKRLAGGDAGKARHRGGGDAPGGGAVHGPGHTESRWRWRGPTRCRRRSWTGFCSS